MSEPKLISPMLDNFAMGDPITDHNGVRCCPAMDNSSKDKYIVKIISVPSTQAQLDALLLSGAYSDTQAALSYFKSLADGIVEEAEILRKLSQMEGFLPFDNWQLIPMDTEPGYDVYLLGSYKRTLAHILRNSAMTHLRAINLGLDLCAALAVCRRSGYLYVDLKPDNIYQSNDDSYKIGDIGFIKLDSLKYASLADRYHSQYTAPEIVDAFSSVNTTVDVYALGLILYQIYNGGQLPVRDEENPNMPFSAPDYADYEMAEIILKACNPDPLNRWQDPVELGQALVSYMQRNGANDTPITPVLPIEDSLTHTDVAIEGDSVPAEHCDTTNDDTSERIEQASEIPEDSSESLQDSADIYSTSEDGNLFFLDTEEADALLDQEVEEINYSEVSDEVSDILNQVDELVAHPAPEPVIPPEPVEVTLPEQLQDDFNEESTVAEQADPDAPSDADDTESTDSISAEETDDIGDDTDVAKPHSSHWLRNVIIAILLLSVATIGFLFYTKYYLQSIESITLEEHNNGDLTVYVSSQIDESKLTAVCSDTYGNQLLFPIVDGKATITGLAPNSAYTIELSIDGFHRLVGHTSEAFTTPVQTNIVQFIAITGSEDGSVILNFTVDGPDSSQWKVTYSGNDQPEQSATFSGHMYTITGLTIGSSYKFTLAPVDNLNFTGITEVTHTAGAVVKASNLQITACVNNTLTTSWSAPDGASIESWTVRCYNENGFDKTIVATETFAEFDGVDTTSAYTVEVTAAGMSVNERTYAPANSITVLDFKVDESESSKLMLSWVCSAETPNSEWHLFYSVDGSAAQEIPCDSNCTATLSTKIPGAQYLFTLQAAEGSPVLGGQLYHKTQAAKEFSGYSVTAQNMEFKMCKTPSKKNWDRYDLSSSDYTTTFKLNEKASFLVKLNRTYKRSTDKITTLYVIRDQSGVITSVSSTTSTWRNMWYRNYCELDIPSLPQAAGDYSIAVFFNGGLACTQNFSIS